MKDVDLYGQILGLSAPWFVNKVEISVPEHAVKIEVVSKSGHRFKCPECGKDSPGYDTQRRRWRHLDTCQLQTLIEADVPRINCDDHGVRLVKVAWAEGRSQFTQLFERFAIDVLQQCSVTAACKLLGITWDEAWGIKERAVRRGLARREPDEVAQIGIDEKAIAKGHKYYTLVYDLVNPRVLFLTPDREKASLDRFWPTLMPWQINSIEAVAMDMWDPFITSTRENLPEANSKIVFDRFHVQGYLSKAVDMVRRQENRELVKEDDERLKGTKYLWLKNPENMTKKQRSRFRSLKDLDLKVAKAWAMKENFNWLWSFKYFESAAKHINAWFKWVAKSKLAPMIKAAETLIRHMPNILTYLQHGITNAVAEGLNSKIKWIQSTARGFRNPKNFETAVYFHCGALNLYPLESL